MTRANQRQLFATAMLAILGACSDGGEATDDESTTTTGASTSVGTTMSATTTTAADGPGPASDVTTDPTQPGDTSDDGSSSDTGEPLPPDPCIADNTCPPGVWINVTPADMAVLEFGAGPVVVDPKHPSDLYLGGGGDGIWKSADYGNTWTKINDTIGYVPMGLVIAVAGTEPATLWVAGYNIVYRSTDGGTSFDEIPIELPAELYSMAVDPYDDDHLISGLHEADGLVESFDGGSTWELLAGTDFPAGGRSWYPFFVDDGDPETTRQTWFAIAQDGGSATITHDGGASWTIPTGIEGLQHPHGNAQIHQLGDYIFAAGTGGPGGGVYRSADAGLSFERVAEGDKGIAWGTENNVYAMWGWACASCDLGAGFTTSALPGDAWSSPEVPADLVIGANHIAVTSDGTHNVFVGTMWAAGMWRYVEP